jgi:Fe-S oxidoreductase
LAQRRPGDLTGLLSGSEGTLAVIWSATLRLCPLPKHRSLVLYFFSSVAEAMQAAVVLHDLKPAAVEHIDRQLFDQTRNRAAFKAARELLKLDEQPCEAILVAEFFDETGAQTREALRRELGVRRQACASAEEREIVWAFRRAGLSLLTGRRGAAKPVAGIEDVAVSPAALPAYVAALEEIIRPLGVEASFYGHAGSGLLHVRPVLDMHQAADIAKYRRIVEETAKLTTKFRGVFCAEHGAGIARTEFLDEHLGPELAAAGRELKKLFDPRNVLNPGKLVANGAYRVDENLRFGAGYAIQTPQAPVLPAFVKKDGSFTANLEQCNGCGGCLKSPATMCPTFQATGDELMSPRGRANVIRAALDGRLRDLHSPLSSEELDAALSNCLSCRACVVECPSNVDIALLKAALLCAQHAETGPPLRARLIAAADLLGRLGTTFPRLAGATLRNPLFRKLLERVAGFTTARPLPTYAAERFDRWFHKQAFARERAKTTRGQVVLWDDTFTRYHETHIGRAAVKVLQAAGYEVLLPEGRKCCGRPAFSAGLLDEAVKLGRHNVPLLKRTGALPIIFLEPSCLTMVAEDYLELEIPEAASVAKRCVSFERFVGDLLEKEPHAIAFDATQKQNIAVHVHCHAKAVGEAGLTAKLLAHLPGATVRTLATGCCGMAGAFGMFKEKYELSRKVAEPLVRQIQALPAGTILAAAGTSCRQQIAHLTDIQPKHTAEILAERIT